MEKSISHQDWDQLIINYHRPPCKYTGIVPVHSALFWNTERCTATFTSAFGLVDHLQLQWYRRILTQECHRLTGCDHWRCEMRTEMTEQLPIMGSSRFFDPHFLSFDAICMNFLFVGSSRKFWVLINSCSIQQLWSCRWCYTHCETSICVSQLTQMQNVISAQNLYKWI